MHIFIKFGKKASITVLGFSLLILGMIMLFTPGPGWLFIILGLGLLATEYEWAKNSLEKAKHHYHQTKQKTINKLNINKSSASKNKDKKINNK